MQACVGLHPASALVPTAYAQHMEPKSAQVGACSSAVLLRCTQHLTPFLTCPPCFLPLPPACCAACFLHAAVLWRFMALDISDLPHVNPALTNVLFQGSCMKDIKRGHFILQAVFRWGRQGRPRVWVLGATPPKCTSPPCCPGPLNLQPLNPIRQVCVSSSTFPLTGGLQQVGPAQDSPTHAPPT
jgi:hypothetical protein